MMNINPPSATPVVLPFTNPKAVTSQIHAPRRLPGMSWMPDGPRNHLVAMLGEFAGTFLFLFFAFSGTQVANIYAKNSGIEGPNPSVLLYIALSFGFSLAVNVWVFFRISGGAFNPAVRAPFIENSGDITYVE
jgi:aquaporin related protein